MQLKIPIISAMLLISDNFKHWSLFFLTERGAKIISILAFTHVVSLGPEQLQTQTDLPLGFERQQMLGISLNTLEGIICHLGPRRSPFVQRFAETRHEQYLKMFNRHLASFKIQNNTLSLFEGVDLLVALEKQLKSNCLNITHFHPKFHNRINK